MKMVALNWTDRAKAAATLIGKNCGESHRGASRYWGSVRKGTFGIVLYGNDGYAEREGGNPVINARTREYVHNLYAGLANLLPEGRWNLALMRAATRGRSSRLSRGMTTMTTTRTRTLKTTPWSTSGATLFGSSGSPSWRSRRNRGGRGGRRGGAAGPLRSASPQPAAT